MKKSLIKISISLFTFVLPLGFLVNAQSNLTLLTNNFSPSDSIGQTYEEMGERNYQELVRYATDVIANFSTNVPLRFPLGINSPIKITEIDSNANYKKLEVICYLDHNGKLRPITSDDLLEMFAISQYNGGSLPDKSQHSIPETYHNNSSTLMTRRIAVFDLLVRDQQTKKFYLLPNFSAILFEKAAVNAVLNRQIQISDVNLDDLNIRLNNPNPPNPI